MIITVIIMIIIVIINSQISNCLAALRRDIFRICYSFECSTPLEKTKEVFIGWGSGYKLVANRNCSIPLFFFLTISNA